MFNIKLILICFTLFSGMVAEAQTGKISGKVVDAITGEELIGASVYLKSMPSKGTATDFDGRFLLENLKAGKDTLVVTYVSYTATEMAIEIKEGVTIQQDVTLNDKASELGPVIFYGTINRQSITSFMIEQKKAPAIGNGITAEVMKKLPDHDAGGALKRVSGATLQGGKFAIIRGLNERYNLAMINNSPLPSTEPEKRAFSLDLFPSNMLDQLMIVKSGTPEYPGDWSGGIILIKTREVPDDPFFTIGLSSSINSLTTFNHFENSLSMKNDWIGLGSKARELPEDFPTTQEIFAAKNSNRKTLAEYGKLLPNNYAFETGNATPNGGLNFSGGRNYKLSSKNRLGVIFSGLYGNSRSFKPVDRYWWTTDGMRALHYTDSTFETDVRLGGMVNITLRLGSNHKLTLKNTYNHNGEDVFTKRSGLRDAEGTYLRSFSYQYTFNRMVYSQLSGEHVLGKTDGKKTKKPVFDLAATQLAWELGYGNTLRNLPDYRNVEYQTQDPESAPYRLKVIQQNGSEDLSRLFTTLREEIKGASFKLETPYKFTPRIFGSVKAGYYHQFKNRFFSGRFLSYSRPSSGFQFPLLELPVDRVFDPSSFFYTGSGGPNGLLLDEITRPYHSYFAQSSLHAGFIQAETNIGLRHRFIYGVRNENYHQVLESKGQNGENVRIDTIWRSWLPSLNYVFQLTEKANLRASYFRSVSRPDFRELAPFSFLDFQTFSILRGNPGLQLTTVDNAEARFEFYPGGGQVFSASLFYKRFKNPIELLLDNSITLGAIGRLYANLPLANSIGAEIDFRKNLGTLDTLLGTRAFRQFTVYGNFSYIISSIDLQGQTNTFNSKRPMQGQSPYIANLGLQWESKSEKWIATALFNRFGERINSVGTNTLPDIYEKARTVLDLQVSRKLMKDKMELKLSFQDMLARDLIYFFDYDSNKKYNEGADRVVYRYKMPRVIGFGISYKF